MMEIRVSKQIKLLVILSSRDSIYLNILILEDKSFCVEVSKLVYTIVGEKFDECSLECETYYETPYSLLLQLVISIKIRLQNHCRNVSL